MKWGRYRGFARGLAGVAVVAVALGLLGGSAGAQDATLVTSDATLCGGHTKRIENQMRIPSGLLGAIALTESGRRVPGGEGWAAWPWTINAAGRGMFFETKRDAINETRRLLREGIESIDVGCMQINLKFHPDAFTNLDDAFDPATNVAYGGKFLAELFRESKSWTTAVGQYHSRTEVRGDQYREKVLAFWRGDIEALGFGAELARRETEQTPFHFAAQAFSEGRFADAQEIYLRLTRELPDDRLARLGRAMSLARLGRSEEALMAYEELLILAPESPTALKWVFEYVRTLVPGRAIERLKRLAEITPTRPEFPALAAQFAVSLGRFDQAAGFVEQAVAIAPEDPILRLNAASVHDQNGSVDKALAQYEAFIRLYHRSPVPLSTSLEVVTRRIGYLRTLTG